MSVVFKATCGVDGTNWVASMHDDIPPAGGSFCPECKARGMKAPGVLHWHVAVPRPKVSPVWYD